MDGLKADAMKLRAAAHALIGYTESLEVGTVITQEYIGRLKDYYIPQLLEAIEHLTHDAENARLREWQGMEKAWRDGRRYRLKCHNGEYDGWYENEKLGWLGMDEDWNLLQLAPTHFKPLQQAAGEQKE